MSIIGYKGFDKNLKCKEFQYEIGKKYEIPAADLKMCKQGFHFCYDIFDIDQYYPFSNKNNRYCEIIPHGYIISEKQKSVTNVIEIVRELNQDEIIKLRNKKYWDIAEKLTNKYPHFLIGGSMALIMVGLIEENRVFHDLDITIPHYVVLPVLPKENNVEELQTKGSSSSVSSKVCFEGINIDFFIDPHQKPQRVLYNNRWWNITNINTILKAKMDYIFNNYNCCSYYMFTESQTKHINDLKTVFNKLITGQNEELPF